MTATPDSPPARIGSALPWASLGLIALNLAVFLLQHFHPAGVEGARAQWGCIPRLITGGATLPGTAYPAWLGLLTAVFMHARWSHIGGNMAVLLAVGPGVERTMLPPRFLALYLASGVLANLGAVLTHPAYDGALVGASTALAGVWAAWMLSPRECLAATLPPLKAAGLWQPLWRLAPAAVLFVILAAVWSWFGGKLVAAADGTSPPPFTSLGFSSHVFGALTGLILGGAYYLVRWRRQKYSA